MCLIFFALKYHEKYDLIIAGNRDEFLDRPSAKIHEWEGIYGGRDLRSGGTWLGVTESGRICAITNIRRMGQKIDAPSRGEIVTDYLKGEMTPFEYLTKLSEKAEKYNGFNLLVGDRDSFFHFNNSEMKINRLSPGVYGVSNATLDTPWPKLVKGKNEFDKLIENREIDREAVFDMLRDTSKPKTEDLPETGVGLEWEKVLSSIFIESENYGTRCSSIITVDDKEINFFERTYDKESRGDALIRIDLK